jgi:hypothetical protein
MTPEPSLRAVRELLDTAREVVDAELHEAETLAEENRHLAMEYERTAALYRRRSAARPDEAELFARRAEWFEARAKVKRAGGIMPRELRTPAETLRVVDELRRLLALSLGIARDLDCADFRRFARCLADPAPFTISDEDVQALTQAATHLAHCLGIQVGDRNKFELCAYDLPLVEEPSPPYG